MSPDPASSLASHLERAVRDRMPVMLSGPDAAPRLVFPRVVAELGGQLWLLSQELLDNNGLLLLGDAFRADVFPGPLQAAVGDFVDAPLRSDAEPPIDRLPAGARILAGY